MFREILRRARARLTARSTVIALLLLLAAALTAAAFVPQAGSLPPGGALPQRGALTRWIGLDRILTTRWFLAVAVLFLLSLVASTLEQLRVTRARLRQAPGEGSGGEPCPRPPEEVERLLAGEGYRPTARAPGRARFVKHGIGYWGNLLLHAGMTLTVLFSLAYVLTEHRTCVHVVSGHAVRTSPGLHLERRGALAGPAPLPAEITLYRLHPAFGVGDRLSDLGSDLVFTDESGQALDFRVGLNDYRSYRGLTVYQMNSFGTAFHLELSGPGGDLDVLLELPMPASRAVAAYGNHTLEDGQLLKAKYFTSADRSTMIPDDPQLFLRLHQGERLVAEATLRNGERGLLGPWRVRLARVAWWTEILFDGSLGTSGIFLGFAVLLSGGGLAFFVVPREVVVRTSGAGCTVQWRALRFPELYREEGDRLLARCRGGVET